MTQTRGVVVVGGGAAGLCAAIFAARAGAPVQVLETRSTPGAKIRVSGGGRCNILPSAMSLANFATSGSTKTLRNILYSWPLAKVRSFFEEELGLPLYREEDTGKLFPVSNKSRDVVQCLLDECSRLGIEILGDTKVESLEPRGSGFALRTSSGEFECAAVVLATGGLSLPRTGSDGAGLEFARGLGHSIVTTHPALVPLCCPEAVWTELSGIALPIRLAARLDSDLQEQRSGALLFTHRGFSGPVILDLSRHVTDPAQTQVLLEASWHERDATDWLREFEQAGGKTTAAVLTQALPRRLAQLLLQRSQVAEDRRSSELRKDERERLLTQLVACPLPIDGDEGYAKAEVTAGGIPLDEIVTKTLESRTVPGLFLCGEILDVVGHIGGYNFLWAWVSGKKAGAAAAASVAKHQES